MILSQRINQKFLRSRVFLLWIAYAMSTSSASSSVKRHWWLSNRMLAEKHVRKARLLLQSQESADVFSAINLLDAALKLWPRCEKALELKARALLYLRRFKDVANMLEENIPSREIDSSGSLTLSRESVELLHSYNRIEQSVAKVFFKCFVLSKLKTFLCVGMSKRAEREEWKHLVLGQACCHLGMMEDALLLLQSGKRAASAAFRHKSISRSEDCFSSEISISESDTVTQMLGNIKTLLRRRAAGLAALDAGHYLEAARHFSKIIDGKKGTPQGFLAECYAYRAAAYQSSGRVADAIADCNRTLALDPTCIEAITTRKSLYESIRCYTETLQDLEHLKLLYESILRHQKLPGPVWKQRCIRYRDAEGNLQHLNRRINDTLQRLFSPYTVDYYKLLSLQKGSCTRADVECAHRLLTLRHKPDKASHFVDRCEFVDDRDIDAVKDQAKISAAMLCRLLQKAHTSVMASIMEEEAEKKKLREANDVRRNSHLNDRSQQMLHVNDNTPRNGIRNPNQAYCYVEREIHSAMLSSDPTFVEFGCEVEQACTRTFSATNLGFRSSSDEIGCSIQDGVHRISISSEATEFGAYNSVEEDTIQQEFLDSGVFQSVSCRDMADVGNILSHTFRSDSWMKVHQGHNITPLQVT
ncbi:uncharacterized protein LOC131064421 isoform X1 [Cryptomeria japonica]|uniref:uncharacterized protein LOC131064421 isoform X1 n=2 Tax=Cryptomeria japonica TaxID=3369 RepID=UPI0025ABFADD|nr:uncharacterized protein LOC131064421 isoform X1 [Cryptomeria japonica]